MIIYKKQRTCSEEEYVKVRKDIAQFPKAIQEIAAILETIKKECYGKVFAACITENRKGFELGYIDKGDEERLIIERFRSLIELKTSDFNLSEPQEFIHGMLISGLDMADAQIASILHQAENVQWEIRQIRSNLK
jgi:hypothetical protein